MKQRPTDDDVDAKFERLNKYTPLTAFVGLQRIVSQKAEGITLDEVRINTDSLGHRCTRLENGMKNLDDKFSTLQELLDNAQQD